MGAWTGRSNAVGQRRWQSRQHGYLAERLTRAEHIDHTSAIDDLDLTGAHHIEVGQRLIPGRDDRGAGDEVFDLDQPGQGLQVGGLECVVR